MQRLAFRIVFFFISCGCGLQLVDKSRARIKEQGLGFVTVLGEGPASAQKGVPRLQDGASARSVGAAGFQAWD